MSREWTRCLRGFSCVNLSIASADLVDRDLLQGFAFTVGTLIPGHRKPLTIYQW
jgi:hypothetical protein